MWWDGERISRQLTVEGGRERRYGGISGLCKAGDDCAANVGRQSPELDQTELRAYQWSQGTTMDEGTEGRAGWQQGRQSQEVIE